MSPSQYTQVGSSADYSSCYFCVLETAGHYAAYCKNQFPTWQAILPLYFLFAYPK